MSRKKSVSFVVSVLSVVFVSLISNIIISNDSWATMNYDNNLITDTMLRYVGRNGVSVCQDANRSLSYPGQCKQTVNCILSIVSGGIQYPVAGNNYHEQFKNAGGIEISASGGVKGDIIQSSNHTALVVTNYGGNKYKVVDSNWSYDSIVRQHDWTIPKDARIWRMGTIKVSSVNNRNIYAINRNGLSNSTELHVINLDNPKKFTTQTGTILHKTDNNWSFDLADYNKDGTPDLYAIKHKGSSGKVEIHIIDGAKPSRFLLQAATALNSVNGSDWVFSVSDYNKDARPDIYAIKRKNTGTTSTEIHIINIINPKQFLLQTGTGLHQTDTNWDFKTGDYNKDGRSDVYAIKKRNTGSLTTEIHIINPANPKKFLLQTGTSLRQTDSNWDFKITDYNKDNRPDIYAIKKKNTGTVSTEAHIINIVNPKQFLLQTGTALHQTDANWFFR